MKARVLTGSKREIAEGVVRIDGEIREAIVFVEEPAESAERALEDMFAEMEPFTVSVGDADYGRQALYTRMADE
jgi:hypothetical protein